MRDGDWLLTLPEETCLGLSKQLGVGRRKANEGPGFMLREPAAAL
jgi:hypothetical protein